MMKGKYDWNLTSKLWIKEQHQDNLKNYSNQ